MGVPMARWIVWLWFASAHHVSMFVVVSGFGFSVRMRFNIDRFLIMEKLVAVCPSFQRPNLCWHATMRRAAVYRRQRHFGN